MASSSFDKGCKQTDGSFRSTASDLTADLNHRFRSYDCLPVSYQLVNRLISVNYSFRHVGDDSFDACPTSPRNLASLATESLPHLHLKTQSEYAEQNDAEHVMTTLTTSMRHSPAFDIVGAAGAGCSNPVLGVDRRRSPKAYKVRCTQG